MKVSYAAALLLAVVSAASSTEVQKSTASPPPQVQSPTTFPGPGNVPYPAAQSYQYMSEYAGPMAKSSFAPKAAVPSSAFAAYQPYQQYGFGSNQQHYPGAGYSAAGPYTPTPYSAFPYSAQPYAAQPYSVQPYSAQPYNSGSYNSYPGAFPSYYGSQFGVPSAAGPYNSHHYSAAAPYNGHYSGAASPTVTPYSALPSAYPQQPLQHSSSFYNSGQQYNPSQQYLSQQQQYPSQQYQSIYGNSPAAPASPSAVSDSGKASAERK